MDPAEGGGGEAIIMCKKKQKTPDENKYKCFARRALEWKCRRVSRWR
jgi:hypothetical protein